MLLLLQGAARIAEQLRSRLEASLQKLQADDLDETAKEEASTTSCSDVCMAKTVGSIDFLSAGTLGCTCKTAALQGISLELNLQSAAAVPVVNTLHYEHEQRQ